MLLLVAGLRQEIFLAGDDLTLGRWNHLEVSSLTRGAAVLLARETSAEAVGQSPLVGSVSSPGFLRLLAEQSRALGRYPGEAGGNYVALPDTASEASSVAFK